MDNTLSIPVGDYIKFNCESCNLSWLFYPGRMSYVRMVKAGNIVILSYTVVEKIASQYVSGNLQAHLYYLVRMLGKRGAENDNLLG
jgi:hypothetical protein